MSVMNEDGSIDLVWAGDVRKFRLGVKELKAIEDARNAGLLEIVDRLRGRTWRIDDIAYPIRIGLIGAGMDAKKAQSLIDDNVTPGRIADSVLTAAALILSAVNGSQISKGDQDGGK